MSEPIDFQARRDARSGPDPEHVSIIVKDGAPEKWFRFGVEFDAGGKTYGFDIWAMSDTHAEEQLAALKLSARVIGQCMATVIP